MIERTHELGATAVQQQRAADEAAARAAKLRRNAWLIGLLALGFYVGFLAWNLLVRPRLVG